MAKIVLVSGSTSRDSVNTAVLATVGRIFASRPGRHETEMLSLAELPFYSRHIEQEDSSEPVRAARALVGTADAVIISTPSYNGEMSGVLKNALDWLSRPYGRSALTGKVVALASASPGARGAVDAQAALAGVLTRSGAQVVTHEPVAIGKADALRTPEGYFTDPAVIALLESLTGATLAELSRHAEALV